MFVFFLTVSKKRIDITIESDLLLLVQVSLFNLKFNILKLSEKYQSFRRIALKTWLNFFWLNFLQLVKMFKFSWHLIMKSFSVNLFMLHLCLADAGDWDLWKSFNGQKMISSGYINRYVFIKCLCRVLRFLKVSPVWYSYNEVMFIALTTQSSARLLLNHFSGHYLRLIWHRITLIE